MERTWAMKRVTASSCACSFQKAQAAIPTAGMVRSGILLLWPPRTRRLACHRAKAAVYHSRP